MAEPTNSRVLQSGKLLGSAFASSAPERMPRAANFKRAFDVGVALTLLLVVAPMMLCIWAIVRFDGGPGLFGHPRIGQQGRTFRCLKFRTMATNSEAVLLDLLANDSAVRAEWERSRKLTRDPRITPIGRLLRATSLDELPQLFNVVRGDMSLVGPRPVVRSEIDQFYLGSDRLAYLSVRPGVTGLWQVSGRSDASYEERVKLDREYVNTATLSLDLAILWRTVAVVLGRRGAY